MAGLLEMVMERDKTKLHVNVAKLTGQEECLCSPLVFFCRILILFSFRGQYLFGGDLRMFPEESVKELEGITIFTYFDIFFPIWWVQPHWIPWNHPSKTISRRKSPWHGWSWVANLTFADSQHSLWALGQYHVEGRIRPELLNSLPSGNQPHGWMENPWTEWRFY